MHGYYEGDVFLNRPTISTDDRQVLVAPCPNGNDKDWFQLVDDFQADDIGVRYGKAYRLVPRNSGSLHKATDLPDTIIQFPGVPHVYHAVYQPSFWSKDPEFDRRGMQPFRQYHTLSRVKQIGIAATMLAYHCPYGNPVRSDRDPFSYCRWNDDQIIAAARWLEDLVTGELVKRTRKAIQRGQLHLPGNPRIRAFIGPNGVIYHVFDNTLWGPLDGDIFNTDRFPKGTPTILAEASRRWSPHAVKLVSMYPSHPYDMLYEFDDLVPISDAHSSHDDAQTSPPVRRKKRRRPRPPATNPLADWTEITEYDSES